MFFNSLSLFDQVLWIVIAVCQFLLSGVVYRTELRRRYPRFSAFIHFCTAKTAILILLPGWLYGWSYFVACYAALLLAGAAIGELYGHVLQPKSLPAWIPRHVGVWLACAVSISASLALIFHPTNGSLAWAILGGTEAGLTSALFFASMILCIYARWLDTAWRPWPARIAAGLVLWLAFNAAGAYLVGLFDDTEVLHRIGLIAHVSAWIWWTYALWQKEPRLDQNTIKALAHVALDQHAANLEASRFISPALREGD